MAQPRDFGFGADESLLRDQARKFLRQNASVKKLRTMLTKDHEAVYERGERPRWDEDVWAKLVELGWPALAVPEDAGGVGAKMVGLVALVEEVGRVALPSPLLSTFSACFVLREADTDVAKRALGAIADGGTATLAISDRHGSPDVGRPDVVAAVDGDSYVLSGTASFVQDAAKAAVFVVSARHGDDLLIAVVPKDAVTVVEDRIVDLTRDQAHVVFDGVRIAADAIVSTTGHAVLARAMPSVYTMLAADLVGVSEWQLETTAQYARVREQFGKPIGSFQAVKHPIVDMMLGIDLARSLVYDAACAIDTEPETAAVKSRMAKAKASDVGRFCSSRSVQLHGGIGFTFEHDVHLFFKRSAHGQFLFGDGVAQRRALASLLIG